MQKLFSCMAATSLLLFATASQASSAHPAPGAWSAPDAAAAIASTINERLFDPAQTRTAEYRGAVERVAALAAKQPTREAFVAGFNDIWREGPFSHVRLDVARAPADQLADRFDAMRVGDGGATLAWQDDVAILTVNTMMGQDTIEKIHSAYADIAARGARALVIDLRNNEGGAFAVRPLVAHTLPQTLEAGVFLGRAWSAQGQPAPGLAQAEALPAWDGWTLKAFWNDVEREGVLRIRMAPSEPVFAGPIYVLTSRRTASAAEMAADALQTRGRAVVVGERTAGRMLSQKMFDVPGGLQISLPIADYRSHHGGRIEGLGVQPDVVTTADEALARALALATPQH